jgi:WD40 repeat protein
VKRIGAAAIALAAALLAVCGAGQAPPTPGPGPELYGAGLFSTGEWDFFLAMSPDERRALFCRANASYLIFSGMGRADSVGRYDIYLSRRDRAGWRRAGPAPSGVNSRWLDFNQSVSPDGQWLYFSSTRPHAGPLGERFDFPRNDSTVAGIGNRKGDMYRIPIRALGL